MEDTNIRGRKVALLAFELAKGEAWLDWKEYAAPSTTFDEDYIREYMVDEDFMQRAEELLDKLLA